MHPDHRARLDHHFATWIPADSTAQNPTYVALVEAVRANPSLLEVAALVERPQFPANLLFAAVHDLLLAGVDHPLAAAYPSAADSRQLPAEALDSETLGERFADFVADHRDDVVATITTRATQTNEVQRSGVLAAALAALPAPFDGAIGLVDAGCSAGLNLHLDRYALHLDDDLVLGDPQSSVTVRTERRGARPGAHLPTIAARVGLDQHPLDVASDDDARWLRACLWPDDLERFRRLDAALTIARTHQASVTTVAGDLVDDLASAVDRVDPALPVVIVTSWATAYLTPDDARRFAAALTELASRRPLAAISMEPVGALARLGLDVDAAIDRDATALATRVASDGSFAWTALGTSHPHGYWLDLGSS